MDEDTTFPSVLQQSKCPFAKVVSLPDGHQRSSRLILVDVKILPRHDVELFCLSLGWWIASHPCEEIAHGCIHWSFQGCPVSSSQPVPGLYSTSRLLAVRNPCSPRNG